MKTDKEKKQMIVIGALVLAIISVGAFQMLSGQEPPPAAKVDKSAELAKKEAEEKAASEAIKNPSVATALPIRDPFKPASFSVSEDKNKPVEPPKPPVERHHRNISEIPPLPTGPLSNGSGTGPGTGTAAVVVEPLKFNYVLAGIIVGTEPAAVFTDTKGNQLLVRTGNAIDGDSRVVSIRSGRVRVLFNGKFLDLTIGGNPSGN